MTKDIKNTPFWKQSTSKEEQRHGALDVNPPETSVERDSAQVIIANGTFETSKQTSVHSAQMDQVLQMHKSTPPDTSTTIHKSTQPSNSVATMTYSEFLNNGMVGSASVNYVWSLITFFKQFFINRFEYTNVKFNYLILEERLFLHGAVCIYELLGEYYPLPFKVIKYDLNGLPKIIKPLLPKDYTIEINGKIIDDIEEGDIEKYPYFLNDMNGMWQHIESYSPIMRHWFHFQNLSTIRLLLHQNLMLTGNKLVLNTTGMSDNTKSELYNVLSTPEMFVLADLDNLDIRTLEGIVKMEDSVIRFDDRNESLIIGYEFTMDELKVFIGARTNAGNTDKKERMVNDEINVNNSATKMSLRVEEELRIQGVERCNKAFGWNASVKCFEIEEAVENDKYNNDKQDLKKGVENV